MKDECQYLLADGISRVSFKLIFYNWKAFGICTLGWPKKLKILWYDGWGNSKMILFLLFLISSTLYAPVMHKNHNQKIPCEHAQIFFMECRQ